MKNNMKIGTALVGALLATTSGAMAGGIERSHSPYAILWEKGNYVELSFGKVNPTIKGKASAAVLGGLSGDIGDSYSQVGLGIKYAINDQLDLAIVLDQPVGANVTYPAGTAYPIAGSTAKVTSNAITALARYKFNDGFAVHGGIKVIRTEGRVNLVSSSFPGGSYKMNTSKETDIGYLIGASYERPDIALRVALTYQSAVKHAFSAVETNLAFGGAVNTKFDTTVPQSLTLDFQTGIAADTLLFGSVRWRDWSEFKIAPTAYTTGLGQPALVDYKKDVVTWTVGVGRKFTDNFSGAISFSYEDKNGLPTGNLGPHDGMASITLGGTYTQDNMKITAGISYVKIGDATTATPIAGRFENNKAVGVGVKVGYSF